MNYDQAKAYLEKYGQSGLLRYYDELDDGEKELLLGDIQSTDFSVLELIGKENKTEGEISPLKALSLSEIEARRGEYVKSGLNLIKNNKVAAVLLAGGQGTRLGSDKPKGMFDIGKTRVHTIFAHHMETVKSVAELSGNYFPLFIMTSRDNDAETRAYFGSNFYFGYPKDRIFFFVQNAEPACSFDGKVFLAEKHRVMLTPNGNGGWYSSLVKSGLNRVLKQEGVEWLNVFGIDNLLQKICDPAFVGATALSGCNCSSKVVKKVGAEEKVGVLCRRGGKPAVVEYYEMSDELKNLRGEDGELVYRYGVILNYIFNVGALDATVSEKLPYHLAIKAIPHIENGVKVIPDKPNGYKFETLVVDMVGIMESCLAFEVEREKEFAPLKNRTGADSVRTAVSLLEKNGYKL